MKLIFGHCLIFLSISLLFGADKKANPYPQNLDQILKESLGADIIWLSNGKNHPKSTILKKLGKADEQDKERLSYVRNRYKYALNIFIEKDQLSRFTYKLTQAKKPSLSQLLPLLDKNKIKAYPEDGHKKARYLSYPYKNYLLLFKNNSKKELVRVKYAP